MVAMKQPRRVRWQSTVCKKEAERRLESKMMHGNGG